MQIKMKPLIICVLLIVISLCRFMPLSEADPETTTVWVDCENSQYRNGSAFKNNLNKVLDSLVKNVYPTGFNTSSSVVQGKNSNSSVYGLVQCRGDLDSSDCKQCVSTAKAELVQRCQNISGLIQLDGCFLRYDNHNFYSNIETTPTNLICNGGTSSQPQNFTDAVNARLLNITDKAAQSPQLFAADYSLAVPSLMEHIYIIAECWRDLSQTSCGSCLTSAYSAIESCETGAIGAQFESKNCYLRYEVYKFFNTSVLPPPPPPPCPPPFAPPLP